MEMTIDKSTVSNAQNSVAFKTTENSAKIFSMLASFLYSDRELAVLHELAANAVDAHKMVGKADVPIEVHLPTQLSPNLIIRDFGAGLHHDDVIKYLTTYGESNKSGSNDFIGGYGIGSKSPAAVSDTWQILSKHAGIANQYLVTIDNQGIPLLTKLRESPTDESGLEVTIPANPSRIRVWATAASAAFQYYTVPPIIKGLVGQPKPPEYIKEHSLFKIKETHEYSRTRDIKAISGIRGYNIDLNQIRASLNPEYLSLINASCGYCFLLPFNIGELDLDLSREKLRYNSRTIETITNRLNAVGEVIKKEITDGLVGLNRIEYYIKALKFYTLYGNVIFDIIKGNPYGIQGQHQLNIIEFQNNIIEGQYKVGLKGKIATLNHSYTCGKEYSVSLSMLNKYENLSPRLSVRLAALERIVFVLNDDKTVVNRVRHSSAKDNKIYVIGSEFNSLDPCIQSIAIKGSSLPDAPLIARGPKRAAINTELYVKSGNRFLKVLEEDCKSLHNAGTHVYVCTEITSATSISSDVYEKDTKIVLDFMVNAKLLAVKKGKPIPSWTKHVKDVAVELAARYEKEAQHYHHNCKLRGIKADIFVSSMMPRHDKFPNSELKSFLIYLNSIKEEVEGISNLPHQQLAALQLIIPNLTSPKYSNTIVDIEDKLEKMKKKYPMLVVLYKLAYRPSMVLDDVVVEYVKLVEKSI